MMVVNQQSKIITNKEERVDLPMQALVVPLNEVTIIGEITTKWKLLQRETILMLEEILDFVLEISTLEYIAVQELQN